MVVEESVFKHSSCLADLCALKHMTYLGSFWEQSWPRDDNPSSDVFWKWATIGHDIGHEPWTFRSEDHDADVKVTNTGDCRIPDSFGYHWIPSRSNQDVYSTGAQTTFVIFNIWINAFLALHLLFWSIQIRQRDIRQRSYFARTSQYFCWRHFNHNRRKTSHSKMSLKPTHIDKLNTFRGCFGRMLLFKWDFPPKSDFWSNQIWNVWGLLVGSLWNTFAWFMRSMDCEDWVSSLSATTRGAIDIQGLPDLPPIWVASPVSDAVSSKHFHHFLVRKCSSSFEMEYASRSIT